MISNQSSQYSNIRAVKTLAIILGCIYISAWTAHLLFLTFSTGNDMLMVGVIHSFASHFISLTGSKLWAYAVSGKSHLSNTILVDNTEANKKQ